MSALAIPQRNTSMPVIEVESLRRVFQLGSETVEALRGVSLSIAHASIWRSWGHRDRASPR